MTGWSITSAGLMDRAREDLAAHLAAHPSAAPTIREVLRTLDCVRGSMLRAGPDGPNAEALGCSRGATIISEAALHAWPDFVEGT